MGCLYEVAAGIKRLSRVMSKGFGMIMIHYVLRMAKEAGVKLRAEFVSNDRNRQMLITYKFVGFKEVARDGNVLIFENDYSAIQPPPPYVELRIEECVPAAAR